MLYEVITVFGRAEMHYLEGLDAELRAERLNHLFTYAFPCLIISRNMDVPDYIIDAARAHKRPLFKAGKVTTSLIHKTIIYRITSYNVCYTKLLRAKQLSIYWSAKPEKAFALICFSAA